MQTRHEPLNIQSHILIDLNVDLQQTPALHPRFQTHGETNTVTCMTVHLPVRFLWCRHSSDTALFQKHYKYSSVTGENRDFSCNDDDDDIQCKFV